MGKDSVQTLIELQFRKKLQASARSSNVPPELSETPVFPMESAFAKIGAQSAYSGVHIPGIPRGKV